jgi:hypothetical protein
MKKKLSLIERFLALSDAEKDAEVAEFAKYPDGYPLSKTRPLNAAERKLWQKAKRKMGRPQIGEGAKIVPVSIERGLLKEVDAFAKRHKLKRSQMVCDGLRMVMRKQAG